MLVPIVTSSLLLKFTVIALLFTFIALFVALYLGRNEKPDDNPFGYTFGGFNWTPAPTHLPDDDTTSTENIKFYRNETPSKPNGELVDVIHTKWFGNYDLLEMHHSYIQYLFPIREAGLNSSAQPLTRHEAETFRGDEEMLTRLLKSYDLMLDFFGMKVKNANTGELERSAGYVDRYKNLNTSSHNYLRITRIMKCLGMMGFEHYKFQFLKFVVQEIFQHGELTNAGDSCIRYWIPTLRTASQVQELDDAIAKFTQGKRVVDRTGKDGNGDEHGKTSWATQMYERSKTSTTTTTDVDATIEIQV